MDKCQTSETVELLVPIARDGTATLGRQIETHLRGAIRDGVLKADATLPSTRDLAAQLGVSRAIVVEAYAQLASEGFLQMRQGARPRVAAGIAPGGAGSDAADAPDAAPRVDFSIGVPDLQAFPRRAWLRATRKALDEMPAAELGYGGRHGAPALRAALAAYLGRVRGVVADAEQVVVTSGFAQTRSLFCRALARRGVRRLAIEDPSYTQWEFAEDAGLELVRAPVDGEGIDITALQASGAEAVIVMPTHQSPTGRAMSGPRRLELLAWLAARDAFALEDDYDAEFRYDRGPIGALQGRAPDRIVYSGTASKTLAPGVRMGWFVAPARLREDLLLAHRAADHGAPRIDQAALAGLIESGDFDRHLRRMRLLYRSRRQALLSAVAEFLPDAEVGGIAAGLHAAIRLPAPAPEAEVIAAAAARGIAVEFLSAYESAPHPDGSTLLLGYAQASESAIRAGVRNLSEILHRAEATPAD